MTRNLRVIIDGTELADEEARAFWKRFSHYMEEHKGDLAGFARAEGLMAVNPELRAGSPILIASRTGEQRAYATARENESGGRPSQRGGSGGHQKTASNRSNQVPSKRKARKS